MDTSNWTPAPGGGGGEEPTMDAGDWTSHLEPDSRQRMVDKLMDTLKSLVPSSGQISLQDLKEIAERVEENIYTSATSQSDYVNKISLKMLNIEMNSPNIRTNSSPSTSGNNSKNPPDTGSLGNQGQSLPIPMASDQAQAHQQLLSQNIQNNIAATAVQGPANLAAALPTFGGLPPTTMPNVCGENFNLQNIGNISGISQNSVGNSVGQVVSSSIFANALRQTSGKQQVVPQQQQSKNPQQQYLYPQQQLQQRLMKQKYQQGSIPNTQMQSQLPQQQAQHQRNQILPQPSPLRSSQQSVVQHSVMHPAPVSGLQQNLQSSVQQLTQPILQQNSEAVLGQHQPSIINQQQTPMQKKQLIGQQPNSTIVQQDQILGQQNSIFDMQQQRQRLLSKQNSLTNLQQQQQLMGQQNNLPNMQQLGPQSNMDAVQQWWRQQQQQLLVNQSGNSSMQTTQHSEHMQQQSKIPLERQNATLLPTQGQQSEPQQQLLSQIQSQPGLLQLQRPNSLECDMQQRLQTSGPLLQSQGAIPDSSLNSTDQTGNANSGDWREEICQKINIMKEAYLPELTEMNQKIAGKLQQYDSLPQQPKHEQLEKLKSIKTMLERILQFLQVPKSSILPNFKEKVGAYEKYIVSIVNLNRLRKPASLQHGQQILPPHIQSIPLSQQSQSQITQAQPMHEYQTKPQPQSMNLQGSSVATMQQNNVTSLQHNPSSSLSGVPTISKSLINTLQPGSTIDSGQGSALNALQQVAVGSLQQNHVDAPQQANINSLSLHSGINVRQPNLTPLQSNSNMLQNQHLKQQDQQMLQTLQKQQFQECHMQQQRQLLHQKNKQQQQNVQLQPHQSPQLHQLNDANDWKMRHQMGAKTGVFQQHHSSGQRLVYHHQQFKSGAQVPISSSQLFQAPSLQMPLHPSPQTDQQNLLTSIAKAGPTFQSTSSHFVFPSLSTPTAPSPILMESEQVNSGVSALLDTGNIGYQQTAGAVTRDQSVSIGTPGILASPLLAEFTSLDGNQSNASAVVSDKSSVTEQPLERFLKVVKPMPPTTLSDSVSDMDSVVSMMDRIAGSAPGNGSKFAVGEDLVAMAKWHLQARNMSMPDTNIGTRKMRRYTSALPLNVVPSSGSANDSFKHLTCSEISDLESTATSRVKRPRFEANHTLLDEIMEINQRLIDTVVCVSDEDVDPTSAAAFTGKGGEGTIVLCSFSAVAVSPNLKSLYASAHMSPIQPLRLLVPFSYPSSSPILLDKFPVEVSEECKDFSLKARAMFRSSLRNLSQPMSLEEIAVTWDACARSVILEYAKRSGGGSFSSKYGTWEDC